MLSEYIKELEEDLKINELNLKDYQLRLPAIKHKWAGRLIRLKLELIQENKKLEKLKKTLAEEVEKASPVKLSGPSINQMIESHATYKDYKAVIEEKKLSIELLEKTEKTLSSTTYDIKNLIEIMKLEMT
jgi:hypothetical protein